MGRTFLTRYDRFSPEMWILKEVEPCIEKLDMKLLSASSHVPQAFPAGGKVASAHQGPGQTTVCESSPDCSPSVSLNSPERQLFNIRSLWPFVIHSAGVQSACLPLTNHPHCRCVVLCTDVWKEIRLSQL